MTSSHATCAHPSTKQARAVSRRNLMRRIEAAIAAGEAAAARKPFLGIPAKELPVRLIIDKGTATKHDFWVARQGDMTKALYATKVKAPEWFSYMSRHAAWPYEAEEAAYAEVL